MGRIDVHRLAKHPGKVPAVHGEPCEPSTAVWKLRSLSASPYERSSLEIYLRIVNEFLNIYYWVFRITFSLGCCYE